jgi:hypothetical protein
MKKKPEEVLAPGTETSHAEAPATILVTLPAEARLLIGDDQHFGRTRASRPASRTGVVVDAWSLQSAPVARRRGGPLRYSS